MTDTIESLKSLHQALIDSRNGYEEALKDAEGRGLTSLFREMIALRNGDADEIAGLLTDLGEQVDERGSFMTVVHKTVMSVLSVFGGLDESVLPGLIDGEERIVSYYDDALDASAAGSSVTSVLLSQRAILLSKIENMKVQKDAAA